ncbi:hypothetical protein QO001_002011 [Methylobacterium brachiatum]|uniref:Nucleotidyltransferase domain-containing protein n=1 Tax=Methylobacterium brachiatum TaxID=269660 RepID=A0AAJ1WVV3_9HYPH|nr:nucleotidyltransferase domain-containing protein [Methylobacterium brachiatum]MCB4802463.1 nucleotidyltransferase domain-containing protein [Methylobacterium brachiatum]MDQ0543085.1 hypothetical protein [Methylobacterium brachiatum]
MPGTGCRRRSPRRARDPVRKPGARGPRRGSDWDLCILLNDDIPPGNYTPGFLWAAVRDFGASIQVVPMRRSVFEGTRRDVNALAYDAAQDGLVLYDKALESAP